MSSGADWDEDYDDWDDVDPDDEPDHYWDDDPFDGYVREEPDCGACNDYGCRSCEPSRLDVLGWRVRSWLRSMWDKLTRRRQAPVDDPWGSAPSATPPASPGGFTGEPPF